MSSSTCKRSFQLGSSSNSFKHLRSPVDFGNYPQKPDVNFTRNPVTLDRNGQVFKDTKDRKASSINSQGSGIMIVNNKRPCELVLVPLAKVFQ